MLECIGKSIGLRIYIKKNNYNVIPDDKTNHEIYQAFKTKFLIAHIRKQTNTCINNMLMCSLILSFLGMGSASEQNANRTLTHQVISKYRLPFNLHKRKCFIFVYDNKGKNNLCKKNQRICLLSNTTFDLVSIL